MNQNILDKIKTTKSYKSKSNQTSGNKYQIKIQYNNVIVSMIFHDNYLNESDKKSFIYSLMMDAMAYENSRNIKDFMSEIGYEDEKQAVKIYNACKKQHERFNKLFTLNEQNQISKLLEDF